MVIGEQVSLMDFSATLKFPRRRLKKKITLPCFHTGGNPFQFPAHCWSRFNSRQIVDNLLKANHLQSSPRIMPDYCRHCLLQWQQFDIEPVCFLTPSKYDNYSLLKPPSHQTNSHYVLKNVAKRAQTVCERSWTLNVKDFVDGLGVD